MTLKVKINAYHFQYQLCESKDAYLVQIWWFQLKSIKRYHTDQLYFLEFWAKMTKMSLKVEFNDLQFQYQPRVS